ncbi:nickel pincer cofactor biosynthesis protein LarC [Pseudonocardia sp. GCM10023141]|uniref:nickel pincer cofactor biosynthesis protein LarC n=1 Tax=Pseudonocardia sp. GCM10023141 TaxID=3252653 RepID=UPI0036210B80
MSTLWLNPATGISGDMLLGALLDLGAPLDGVRAAVAATGLTGWGLDVEQVTRGVLRATRAVVTVTDTATERHASQLLEMIALAHPAPVAALAARAVTAIATVEAALHGAPVASVHLHEIGGHDTVVDTVGVAAALHLLGVTEVVCGPLAMGSGTIRTSHGVLPLPAPATAALLARAGATVAPSDIAGETVTPTGIALLLAADARFGPLPAVTVTGAGYGAGGRDVPDRPNVLQALLGERSGQLQELLLLETNVDDVTGEVLGHLLGLLLTAGAADAWITPIVMKKGRPAHTVHVLVDAAGAAACERIVLAETGTLGIRRTPVQRHALPRETSTVTVGGHEIRLKHGPHGVKPEHDDVAAAAAALDLPLREVAAQARRAGSRTP